MVQGKAVWWQIRTSIAMNNAKAICVQGLPKPIPGTLDVGFSTNICKGLEVVFQIRRGTRIQFQSHKWPWKNTYDAPRENRI